MKGGLAVMIELGALGGRARELAYDLGAPLLPARGARARPRTRCPASSTAAPLIDEAALVICLEPTDNTLQLGCLGNINARVVFEGELGALGAALARRERDRARARGAARRARARAATTSRSTGSSSARS